MPSEPIRLDATAGTRKSGAGNGTRSGTGPNGNATGNTASATGQAGKQPDQNAEANRKGAANAETISKTGPIIIEGGTEQSTEYEQPRKRGRPKGSTNANTRARKQKGQEAFSVEGVTFTLVSIHTILASMMKNPAWEIADVEAKELASAIGKVQEQYPFTLDPKAQAWANLAMVAGVVYAPRVMAMRKSRGENAKAQTTPQQNPDAKTQAPQKPQEKKQTGIVTPSQMYGPLGGRG